MGTLICGVDYETTGLSATEDRITEIGACLYEWETGTPLKLMSTLVKPERPIPEEVVKITGITDELVDMYGKSEKAAFAELHDLMSYADYAAAFNGTRFDHPFYLAACGRLGSGAIGNLLGGLIQRRKVSGRDHDSKPSTLGG